MMGKRKSHGTPSIRGEKYTITCESRDSNGGWEVSSSLLWHDREHAASKEILSS